MGEEKILRYFSMMSGNHHAKTRTTKTPAMTIAGGLPIVQSPAVPEVRDSVGKLDLVLSEFDRSVFIEKIG
jgi:hypothetical protein